MGNRPYNFETDPFEQKMQTLADHGVQGRFKDAIINVADTAAIVKKWMVANEVPFTASDLLGFTRAILAERDRLDLVADDRLVEDA